MKNEQKIFEKVFDGNKKKAELAVNSYNTLEMRLQQFVSSSKVYISEGVSLIIEIERVGSLDHDPWSCYVFQHEKKFYTYFEPIEASFEGLCKINDALTYISKFIQDLNVISRMK